MTPANSLQTWLERLEAIHPKEIDLGLDRIRAVAERLALLPQLNQKNRKPFIFTVAGTNGKGSTCAMIDSLLQAHGVSTGRYGSPHFVDFNERILVNNDPVSEDHIVAAFEAIDEARQDISLTYFEFATLAALHLFRQFDVSAWILEVGLGGRLDATNIVDADVAVVTSIGLDHQDWLGDDITQIGREKAGIFRPQQWAVCGQEEQVEGVVEVAQTLNAKLLHRGEHFHQTLQPQGNTWTWQGQSAQGDKVQLRDLPQPNLPLMNAATALQAISLGPWPLAPEKIVSALGKVQLTGRFQTVQWHNQQLILDVAHNPQAAAHLAEKIVGAHLLVGMLNDKDIQGTLAALAKSQPKSWSFVDIPGPRGLTASALAEALDRVMAVEQGNDSAPVATVESTQFESVAAALESHMKTQNEIASKVPLVVCGSFLTVADALTYLKLVTA